MILPNVASLTSYGSPKANDSPTVDPVTDESADDRNNYVDDVAGMTNTAIRAWRRFKGKASTPPDEPSTYAHGAVWSAVSAPVVARTGPGVYTITWPSSVNDTLGHSPVALAIRGVHRPTVESSTLYHATAEITSANVITVYVFNAAGTANDAVGAVINVAWW